MSQPAQRSEENYPPVRDELVVSYQQPPTIPSRKPAPGSDEYQEQIDTLHEFIYGGQAGDKVQQNGTDSV